MKLKNLPQFVRHPGADAFFTDCLDSATNMSVLPSTVYLVVMGVAGCGKSSLGAALAQAEGLPLIEGDDHHSPASREKMRQGIALTDEDLEGWLATLGQLLQAHPHGAVLTCSSLKKAYRDRLRRACLGLCCGSRRCWSSPHCSNKLHPESPTRILHESPCTTSATAGVAQPVRQHLPA